MYIFIVIIEKTFVFFYDVDEILIITKLLGTASDYNQSPRLFPLDSC